MEADLALVNLIAAEQVLHGAPDLVRVVHRMRERLHLIALHRAREQVDGEHLVGKRERLLRADVRACLLYTSGEALTQLRRQLIVLVKDGLLHIDLHAESSY